jgi:ribosome-associated protein
MRPVQVRRSTAAPVSVQTMEREIAIRGDMIRLGQLLKLADVIDSGAGIKALLSTEQVLVNGERETRRGRQLHPGDTVQVADQDIRITPGPAA